MRRLLQEEVEEVLILGVAADVNGPVGPGPERENVFVTILRRRSRFSLPSSRWRCRVRTSVFFFFPSSSKSAELFHLE